MIGPGAPTPRETGTLVVGAGQAGLAAGRALALRGERFLLVDGANGPGATWRARWDGLRLFTPARFNGLPGMRFPGDPSHHPGKEAVADYLSAYAERFSLRVAWGVRVLDLSRDGAGDFVALTTRGEIRARRVIVATGPFQVPRLPDWADELDAAVVRVHSSAYRSPAQLPTGDTLVVGGANSGVQIAAELAPSRPVTLAVGTRLPRLPLKVLGRSVFWWLERSGALSVPVTSRLGRRASRRDFLIGSTPEEIARERAMRLAPRAVGADGRRVAFADAPAGTFDAVVFATGYAQDFAWLRVPGALDAAGRPRHHRGITSVPGLAFLGLSWMHTRGSALLGWVGRDAAHVVTALLDAGSGRTTPAPTAHDPEEPAIR